MNVRTDATTRAKLAALSVRLAALWVLAVSAIKLFKGSPNSLPVFFRDGFLGPDLNFRCSIAVELAVVALALLRPRWGFIGFSTLFSVFIVVLVYLVAIGAESCGCFGGALQFPPLAMLAVDGALFAFMLVARPWSSLAPRPAPKLALVAAIAVALAAPWIVVRGAAQPLPAAGWHAPTVLPRYAELSPETWVGASIHTSELAPWIDTRALPGDATWILYRIDCDHCRDTLRRLASEFASDPKVYVLIDMASPGDDERRVVDTLPPGEAHSLTESVDWVITPPWILRLEDGVVVAAEHPQ